jgi:hypothetical protein
MSIAGGDGITDGLRVGINDPCAAETAPLPEGMETGLLAAWPKTFLAAPGRRDRVVDRQGNEAVIVVTGGYYLQMMWANQPGARGVAAYRVSANGGQ